uniref:EF-hand domain-containing protein n=1 Tax=Globodera pallida TaxID=36090 RepID=A0A183CM59_GLOPA
MGLCLSNFKRSRNRGRHCNGKAPNGTGLNIFGHREGDLQEIFREFDLNGDGFIQRDELRQVMLKMGQSPTEEELGAMFEAADTNKDGQISFQEFLCIARANPLSLSLKAVFEELDVDGDGHITRSELRTAFQQMGHTLNDADIKAIYKRVDKNQDGKINFKEFCEMMTRGSSNSSSNSNAGG